MWIGIVVIVTTAPLVAGGTIALTEVVPGTTFDQAKFIFDCPKATEFIIWNVPTFKPVVGIKVPFDVGESPSTLTYLKDPAVRMLNPVGTKPEGNWEEPETYTPLNVPALRIAAVFVIRNDN